MPSGSASPKPLPPGIIRRGHNKRRARPLSLKAFHALPPARNWADLPLDALLYIVNKIDHVELLLGGVARVCRSRRQAITDEPLLWQQIDMRGSSRLSFRRDVDLDQLARIAVRRSAGHCQAFWIQCAGDDGFLPYLAEEAPFLESLRLISCYEISKQGFLASIKKFPLLRELEISLCSDLSDPEVFEAIAKSCPKLKHFMHIEQKCFYGSDQHWDEKALAISGMHGLRSLELHCDNRLTNQGLTAIIDSCPHLELLILHDCPFLMVNNILLAKCARISTVSLRGDEYDQYQITATPFSSFCLSCAIRLYTDYDYLGNGFFCEDEDDYFYYSRYFNGGLYVPDLYDDEHSRMVAKSARTYLKISTQG